MNVKKPKKGEEVKLSVERLGIHGEGIAYLDGYALFIDGALPGEKIQAIITEAKPTYGMASLVTVLKNSPHRITPICPIFEKCGGCQIMNLTYQQQLEIKRQRVIDALERIGHLKNIDVLPCLPSPKELSYRNKIQLPVKANKDGSLSIGLHVRRTHDLVEFDYCAIHNPLGEEVYQSLKILLKTSQLTAYDEANGQGLLRHIIIKSAIATNSALVVLVTHGNSEKLKPFAAKLMTMNPLIKGVVQNINRGRNNVILGKENRLLAGIDQIEERICGLKFSISASSFFQVNPLQAEKLYRLALEMAELKPEETILDAYCGVGTLALIAANQVDKVIGIEQVAEAIADAKKNALANEINNAQFYCGATEKLIGTLPPFDVAILNPPRKGCENRVLQELIGRKIPKIVYISCDPATLARDLAILFKQGYQIEKVQPVDMFPQTAHVETIAYLTQRLQ